MKKATNIFLTLLFAIALAGTAFAQTEQAGSYTVPEEGITPPDGQLATLTVNGAEVEAVPGETYEGDVVITFTNGFDGPISTYTNRMADNYRTAIYVSEEGIEDGRSVISAVTGVDGGPVFDDESASNIMISGESDDFSAIIVNNGYYSVKDSVIRLLSDSDGHMDYDWVNEEAGRSWRSESISDFVGLGAAVGAFNGGYIALDNVDIQTAGVAKLAMFIDGGSDVLITNSTISAAGGEVFEGYINTADQDKMVAPPWVLGITGYARATNLEGANSSFTIADVDASSCEWGVLSTDAGRNVQMVVIDSTMTLTGKGNDGNPYTEQYGSGYGTYILGSAKEFFYGVTFNVGTMASISTGGIGIYASSDFSGINHTKYSDFVFSTLDPDNTSRVRAVDGLLEVYAPDGTLNGQSSSLIGTFEGKGQPTIVNSEGFGILAHSRGGDFIITDGTIFNTKFTTFVLKSGESSIYVNDGSQLNAGNGVLVQVMDNDDTLVGEREDLEHYSWPTHNDLYEEPEGYPGIDYETEAYPGDRLTDIHFEAVTLNGDIYNSTGYYEATPGRNVEVYIGADAELNGTISATSAIHVDEDGNQVCSFTSKEYYYISQLSNLPYYNGANNIAVTLNDNAVWNVTSEGIITGLTIAEGATFNGTLTVDGEAVEAAPGTYEGIIVVNAAE